MVKKKRKIGGEDRFHELLVFDKEEREQRWLGFMIENNNQKKKRSLSFFRVDWL